MNTGLETVKKAIEFGTPDYIPRYDGDNNNPATDITFIPFVWRQVSKTAETYTTEWGFVVRPSPGIAGYHVDHHPLLDWKDYQNYAFPDVRIATAAIEDNYQKMLQQNPGQFKDRYVLGHLFGGPYLLVGMLRSEQNFFMDLLSEKERISELFGRVMDYQIEIFKFLARLGCHGVLIHEDWGSAHGLIMSPDSWREIFLPHYRRAKKVVKELGMHFSIQVTGNVEAVMPDILDAKLVDMLFYPEPRAIGIDKLAGFVKGKLCVFTCVDWKSTGPLGTIEDTRAEFRELVQALWTRKGGLSFWLYTMSEFKTENRQAQLEEYAKLRYYQG